MLPEEPITREEQYLSAIAGEDHEIPEKPITRVEQYLDYIARNGGGGSDGDWKDEIENALEGKAERITETASGRIITFSDGVATPVKSAVVHIEPEQDLNGYDKPWPGGAGKNLLPGWFTLKTEGKYCHFSASTANEFPIHLTAGTYTFKVNITGRTVYPNIYYQPQGGTGVNLGACSQARTFTVAEENEYRFWLYANPDTTDPIQESEIVNFQLERGDTATDWEPYENICPIGGTSVARIYGTGKNLLPQKKCLWNSGKNYYLGASNDGYNNFLVPGTYTLKIETNRNDSPGIAGIYAQRFGETPIKAGGIQTVSTFTIVKADYYRIYLYVNTAAGAELLQESDVGRFQLELSSEATDWESYQGGSETSVLVPNEAAIAFGTYGKNLLPNNLENQTKNGLTLTKNSDGSVHIVGTATVNTVFDMPINNLIDGQTYTASGIRGGNSSTYQIYLQTSTGTSTSAANFISGSKTWTQDSSNYNVGIYRIRVTSGATVDFTVYPQIELGSVATEYEPYDGGTIYGGSVDFTAKKLTIDRGIVDIADCVWTYNSTYNRFESEQIRTIIKKPLKVDHYTEGLICSKYKASKATDTGSKAVNGTVAIDNDGRIYLRDEAYTTVADFVQANAGQKIVYPLAEPQVYDVDCGTLSTLLGNNTIWTDAGNMDIEYCADTKAYIDSKDEAIAVSGTDPVITAAENTRYICGEVTSLTFTPSASGICDVVFTSGTTPTVLDLPSSVKLPEWFTVEAETTYEINILDGVYGAVIAWA